MKKLLSLLLLWGLVWAGMRGSSADFAAPATIDPALTVALEGGKSADFLVILHQQPDMLRATRTLSGKEAKAATVHATLTATARQSQADLLAGLAARGVPHRPYWIVNAVGVYGDADTLAWLAARPEVARIQQNERVVVEQPQLDPLPARQPAEPPWGILKVRADAVWALGYRGAGVIVAGQDTGYQWDHPALIASYRGWNGTSADHNYHWHDAIHQLYSGGTNPCGIDSPVPCDDHGHGTHTMGTMTGDDGGSNQIGMAPAATWISCRNMERGWGTLETYIECFEWFVAPTNLAGQNPDPARAPHVINNSWGCTTTEGCNATNFAVMEAVVDNVRAAGIVVVASAGNSGSACGTVSNPAAIYQSSFSVGNTQSNDTMSASSSRGPVTVDGSNRLKPDISAPGTSVYSAWVGSGWRTASGTSMAGPHVAGLVALLISANPDLAGNVDAIENIIKMTAVPVTASQTCGGIPSSTIPNNTFGHGRIDALEAVELALQWTAPTHVQLQQVESADSAPPALPLWLLTTLLLLSGLALATRRPAPAPTR